MWERKSIRWLVIIAIPLTYALVLRLLFGANAWKDVFTMMSTTFLFCLPTLVGALTTFLSTRKQLERTGYRFFAPWIPVILFLLITLVFSIEGWPCLLMILPVFLLAASIGGYIGAWLKAGRRKDNNTYMVALTALPILAAPVERAIGPATQTYRAYTSIDIHAPAGRIWDNVTRVRTISPDEDRGTLTKTLGFPRPVRAVLNYNGVGAYREAVFTDGLVFHETVTQYGDRKKMVFRIQAHPHEIPLTTMDEHLVIGGKYFDVLTGTYELEPLGAGTYRLHLYSDFKLTTTFNFYARWWARKIMQDIQNNILQVEKRRAEAV